VCFLTLRVRLYNFQTSLQQSSYTQYVLCVWINILILIL